MVDGLGILLRRIDPSLEDRKDEQIVCASVTLHSRLAKHSATRGGVTRSLGAGVRPNASNLLKSRPDELPTFTTLGANLRAGMAITHSPVARKAAKL